MSRPFSSLPLRREPFTRADAAEWACLYPQDRAYLPPPPPAPCSPVAGREGVGDSSSEVNRG